MSRATAALFAYWQERRQAARFAALRAAYAAAPLLRGYPPNKPSLDGTLRVLRLSPGYPWA